MSTPPTADIETIAAIATPAGRGGIGVIRISGPRVPDVAVDVLGSLPLPRTARLARFLDQDGSSLDQGLALYFPPPASFTGEAVLELHGHGGAVVLDLLLQRLLSLGCRMARPGEFSERAFLNGKLDMAQAEAVADLIDAGSAAAARAAVRSLQGEFSARIQALQSELMELRVQVEAAIDFPEEDLDLTRGAALRIRQARIFETFDAIKAAARQGTLLREGLNVVIAGRPNAGKSSLLNRLVGDDVAIVTDLPGTTRDTLRHAIQLDGLPVHLVDTAGLRTATDVVEEEGIRRAKVEIERADRVLYVVDGTLESGGRDELDGWADGLSGLRAGLPITVVINKIDLVGGMPRLDDDADPPRLWLSAQGGEGLDLLRAHLKSCAGYREADGGAVSARRRHLDALSRAEDHARDAAAGLAASVGVELVAEELRLAQAALGEITGEVSSDDLLGEIFGSFCIGK